MSCSRGMVVLSTSRGLGLVYEVGNGSGFTPRPVVCLGLHAVVVFELGNVTLCALLV